MFTSFFSHIFFASMNEKAADAFSRAIHWSMEQNDKMVNGVTAIVGGNDSTTGMASISQTVYDTVSGQIIPALSGVGLAIALLIFLMALADLMKNDRLTTEMWIKFFINFIIAFALIMVSADIFNAVIQFGKDLATEVNNVFTTGYTSPWSSIEVGSDSDAIYKAILDQEEAKTVNWLSVLLFSAVIALPALLMVYVMEGLTYFVSFSRILELSIRGSLLPIGFAMLSDDGFKGAGGRYFRKLIALSSQIAVLVLIAGLMKVIMNTVASKMYDVIVAGTNMNQILEYVLIEIFVGFACVSVMFKSIGLINDAFGA